MTLRAVLAFLMLVTVLGGVFAIPSGANASRGKVFTVEVSERGFNPQVCRISRDNYVQFKNVGTATRRVILPGVGANAEAQFDSGDLAPGQTSNQQVFPHGGTVKYFDKFLPGLSVTIVLPVLTAEWEDICTPAAFPPLPVASFGCTVKAHCAVLPSLARDP